MIVCRFTLPRVSYELEDNLKQYFNGFTRWRAVGGWKDAGMDIVEEMWVYEVAVRNMSSAVCLQDTVSKEARNQQEKCLYFVTGQEAECVWL